MYSVVHIYYWPKLMEWTDPSEKEDNNSHKERQSEITTKVSLTKDLVSNSTQKLSMEEKAQEYLNGLSIIVATIKKKNQCQSNASRNTIFHQSTNYITIFFF